MNNNQGSISLFGLLMLLIISMLTVTILKQRVEQLKKIDDRAKTYLCMKHIIHQIKKTVYTVAISNITLATLKGPSLISPQIKILFDVTKMIQMATYISNMKKLVKNRYCSYAQTFSFITTPIYLLRRDLLGRLKLNKRKFAINLIGKKKWNVILKAKVLVKSNIDQNVKIKTKELFQALDLLQ